METKLRNLLAMRVTGDPSADLPETEAKIPDIATTLEAKKQAAAARWGTRWMAESLADDRAIYGDPVSSAIMEDDEDDEVSCASTALAGTTGIAPCPSGAARISLSMAPMVGANTSLCLLTTFRSMRSPSTSRRPRFIGSMRWPLHPVLLRSHQ